MSRKAVQTQDQPELEAELPPADVDQPREDIAPEPVEPDWDDIDTGPRLDGQGPGVDPEAVRRSMAKRGFYAIVVAGMTGCNWIYQNQTGTPLKSLNMTSYGDVGIKGCDQLFDRLYEQKFMADWLIRLAEWGELQAKWGDVVQMIQMIAGSVMFERAMIRQEMTDAANDDQLKDEGEANDPSDT